MREHLRPAVAAAPSRLLHVQCAYHAYATHTPCIRNACGSNSSTAALAWPCGTAHCACAMYVYHACTRYMLLCTEKARTCLAASNGGRCSFTQRCVHPERHGGTGASCCTATGAESSGGFVKSFVKSEKLGRREASSGRREREGEAGDSVAIFAASSRTSRHLRSTSSAAAACSAAGLHG